jgi:hypothetical protein
MARPTDPDLERLWRQRLQRHSASDQSIAAFCSREGVSRASYQYWKRRLTARPSPPLQHPPLFVPVHLQDPPSEVRQASPRGVEVELPHQVRLRFDSPPEPEWLGRVVTILGGLPHQEATP